MAPATLLSLAAARQLAQHAPRVPDAAGLVFRTAAPAPTAAHLLRTMAQVACFWSVCLAVLPATLIAILDRWLAALDRSWALPAVGWTLFGMMSALGLWSAWTMTARGDGTPLPVDAPRKLVVAGPYRWLRNPMACAGIAQGVGIGLAFGSWPVVVYALSGAVLWHTVARPAEERDRADRFGADYLAYRGAVPTWRPRPTPWRAGPPASKDSRGAVGLD